MVMALPFLFAAGGYYAFGTTGMAVGWLVGAWLFGPKGNSTTQGMKPATMPSFNQALRGSTMYITFGANRVSAQMVWSANWKPVRQQASGKGGAKGGGSGGMGSAKGGGSSGTYYTYTFDLVYHYGMVDAPSYARTGWVGGDRLSNDTLNNINSGVAGFTSIGTSKSQDAQTATMTATSYFCAGGYATGDVDLTNWSYMTTQDGSTAPAWPYTFWVGFQKLQLGQSPAIPQLALELVPIGTDFTGNPGVGGQIDINDTGYTVWQRDYKGGAVLITAGGNRVYVVTSGTGHDVALVNMVTGAHSAKLASATWLPFSGSKYIGEITYAPAGAFYNYTMTLYEVNDDLSLTQVGTSSTGTTSGLDDSSGCIGFWSDGTTVMAIMSGNISGLGHSELELYSFSTSDFSSGSSGGSMATYKLADLLDTSSTGSNPSFFTNVTLPIIPLPSTSTALIYVSAYDLAHMVANPGVNAGWDTIAGLLSAPGWVTLGASEAFTKWENGPTDDGYDLSSVASSHQEDGYRAMSISNDGAYISMIRTYYSSADRGADGTYSRIKIYSVSSKTLAKDGYATLFNAASQEITAGPAVFIESYIDTASGDLRYAWFGTSTTLGTQGYVFGSFYDNVQPGSEDVTPPYIIYKILTSTVYGFSVATADIDTTTYNDAVQYCTDEGIKVAVTYTTADNLLSVIDELLSLYGGYLYDDAGKLYFGVVRSTDTPIRTLDNSHLWIDKPSDGSPAKPPVSVTKAALQDGYNIVKFNFLDRSLEYKNNQVEVEDPVDIDLHGPRMKEFQPRFVMPGSLASKIAIRALWSNLYGRAIYNFQLGFKDADLRPGDLITLVDSFHPELQTGVDARIVKRQVKNRGQYIMQAVQDIAYHLNATQDYTATASVSKTNGGLTQTPQNNLAVRAYELPQEFQGSNGKLYFGYNQAFPVMGAQLWLSADSGNFTQAADVQPYIISGMWPQGLPNRPNGWMEEGVELYLMPASGFNSSSPTWAQTHDLDSISQGLRASGAGILICGSEAMSIEGVNLIGQNHYKIDKVYRGWGGTPISQHNSGAYWHYHSAGIFAVDITPDKIGTTMFYKIVPYNFGGVAYNIASIDPGSYAIKGDYWLPRKMPKVSYYVDSAAQWPNSVSFDGRYLNVVTGGCDVVLEWPDASNTDGYGAQGFGTSSYGHFAADTASRQWRVDVMSNNGTKVSSFFVTSGHYRYTRAQNSADFAGFASDVIYEVTPYNNYGDGITTDARSLTLFY